MKYIFILFLFLLTQGIKSQNAANGVIVRSGSEYVIVQGNPTSDWNNLSTRGVIDLSDKTAIFRPNDQQFKIEYASLKQSSDNSQTTGSIGTLLSTDSTGITSYSLPQGTSGGWLSAYKNGEINASIVLTTFSAMHPDNNDGSIFVQTAFGGRFGMGVDSLGGHLGWGTLSGRPLDIQATDINLDGVVHAGEGIIVSNSLKNYIMDSVNLPGAEARFLSTENLPSGIVVENQSNGVFATASAYFRTGNTINSIGTLSNGVFQIQSSGDQGIELNAASGLNHTGGTINFVVSGQRVLMIDNIYNDVLIGDAPPEKALILNIWSKDKGVAFTRMTTEQRRHLASTTEGEIVYDLDLKKYVYYNGQAWCTMCGDEIDKPAP